MNVTQIRTDHARTRDLEAAAAGRDALAALTDAAHAAEAAQRAWAAAAENAAPALAPTYRRKAEHAATAARHYRAAAAELRRA